MWINVNVPDEDLGYVHPGTIVTFQSTSLPGKTFSAPINTVNSVPTSGTLSYLARMELQNPGYVLRGGMLVAVTVTKARAVGAIVVPRSAVAQTPQGDMVYVVSDNKAQAVPVKVGVQTDTMAQVSSPRIQPGTMVVTTPAGCAQRRQPRRRQQRELGHVEQRRGALTMIRSRFRARALVAALVLGSLVTGVGLAQSAPDQGDQGDPGRTDALASAPTYD